MPLKNYRIPKVRLPYVYKQKVTWGDMDAFQHVNHVVYAKYFENARVEFLRDLNIWEPEKVSEFGPVVAKLEMQFKKQVKYPSILDVTIGLLDLQSRSFTFGCTMWDEDNNLVFMSVGDFYWIHFLSSRIVSLPEKYMEKFKPFLIKEF